MDAKNKTLGELLRGGDNRRKFIIPDYQREYDWKNHNFDIFWEDLIHASNKGETFFLGMFTLNYKGEKNNIETYEVVDGQQRITTITLFIKSLTIYLLDKQEESKNRGKISQISRERAALIDFLNISSSYKNRYKEEPKLEASPSIRELVKWYCLEEEFDGMNYPEKIPGIGNGTTKNMQIRRAGAVVEDFYNKIKGLSLNEVLKISSTLKNADVIETKVESDDEAFLLFEVLNDRGKDLEIGDLLKNHIFSKKGDKENFQREWDEIRHNCPNNFSTLLKQFVYINYGYVPGKMIYKRLKDLHPKHPDIFLEELKEYSEWWKLINVKDFPDYKEYVEQKIIHRHSNATERNVKEFKSLEALRLFSFKLVYPLIFSYFKKTSLLNKRKKDAKLIEESRKLFLRNIENHVFYNYLIGRQKVSNFEKIAADFSKKIMDCENTISVFDNLEKDLYEKLSKFKVNKDEFVGRFQSLNYENDGKILRYIFFRMDMSRNKEKVPGSYKPLWGFDSTSANNEIEHWAPQNPPKNSEDQYKSDEYYFSKVYPKLMRDDIHSIGNLLLLTGDQNRDADNNSPKVKLDKLNSCSDELSRFVKTFIQDYSEGFSNWDAEQIRARRQRLSEEAHNVWCQQKERIDLIRK